MKCTYFSYSLFAVAFGLACGGGGIATIGSDRPSSTVDLSYDARVEVIFGHGDNYGAPDSQSDLTPGLIPCSSGSDCPTGFCVEGPDGTMVCAPDCVEGICPPGWACKQVANVMGDVVFVCLPEVQYLCRPCRLSEECRPSGVVTKDLCVKFSDSEGSFCGKDCSDSNACPAGYDCRQVKAADGSKAFQCLPLSGVCQCTTDFIEKGLSTDCFIENQYGRCKGTRTCTENGLTPCNAPSPKPESCNGVDDNCNGQTDEEGAQGCITYYVDQDGDGFGVSGESRCLCKPQPPYTATSAGDCDESDASVNPGAKETCNGKDDNCNGETDEPGAQGCQNYFKDQDKDGWGLGNDFKCLCAPQTPYTATQVTDCQDMDAAINPAASEKCNGFDDNCDGVIDPEGAQGCLTYYEDADNDGFGAPGSGRCLCGPQGNHKVTQAGDCNDNNANVHPNAKEKCNGMDDDCDGQTDEEGAEGCSVYFYDNDGDTYGVAGNSKCLCSPTGKYTATKSQDCNDNNPAINPGASEICDGVDNNCNGQTDEGGVCGTVYKIGINPDDGGGTGACGCSGICEDNLNLSMGLHLRDYLELDTANPNGGGSWQVFMTRTDNSNPSLASRVAYLNSNGVHRAISISCNTTPEPCPNDAIGAETYIKSGADANANDLSKKVQAQVVTHFQTKDRGVKVGNYYVLVNTNMPHIFVFPGFLTNPAEANKLNTDSWRKEAARGMLHGIQQHFGYGEFDP